MSWNNVGLYQGFFFFFFFFFGEEEKWQNHAGPDAISTGPPRCFALDAHQLLSSSSQV